MRAPRLSADRAQQLAIRTRTSERQWCERWRQISRVYFLLLILFFLSIVFSRPFDAPPLALSPPAAMHAHTMGVGARLHPHTRDARSFFGAEMEGVVVPWLRQRRLRDTSASVM